MATPDPTGPDAAPAADVLPRVVCVRHGATAWAASGRHTGRTDVPLTPAGEAEARTLRERLADIVPERVWTSPSTRARTTASLAGWPQAEVDEDLAEWDYGAYEGLTSAQIRAQHPAWHLFTDGCPQGETLAAVSARADRVVQRLRAAAGTTLVFSSGHLLRVLAARWMGADARLGAGLALGTASISILGYEHVLTQPVLRAWNVRVTLG